MNMKSLRRYLRQAFDKGAVLAVGFGCLYLHRQQYKPDISGPLAYGIITAGAIGVTRFIIWNVETTTQDDEYEKLLQILEEQKSEILANRERLEELREAWESLRTKVDTLTGWRRDPALVREKITILKKLLKIRDEDTSLHDAEGSSRDPESGMSTEQSLHELIRRQFLREGMHSKDKGKKLPEKGGQRSMFWMNMKPVGRFLLQAFDKGAILMVGLGLYLYKQRYKSNVSDPLAYGIITAGVIGFARCILQDVNAATDKRQSSVSQRESHLEVDNDKEDAGESMPVNLRQELQQAISKSVQEAIAEVLQGEEALINQEEIAENFLGEASKNMDEEIVQEEEAENMDEEKVQEEIAEMVQQEIVEEEIGEVVQEDILEKVQQEVFQEVSDELVEDEVSEKVLKAISKDVQQEILEKVEAETSQRVTAELTENAQEELSEKSLEEIMEKVSREMLEKTLEKISGKGQETVSEKVQEQVTEKVQEVSEKMEAGASDKVQEQEIKNFQEKRAQQHQEEMAEKVHDVSEKGHDVVTEKKHMERESQKMPEEMSGNLGEKFPEVLQHEREKLEGKREEQAEEVDEAITDELQATGQEKQEMLVKETSEAELENAGKN